MSDPGRHNDAATFTAASFDLDAYLQRIGYAGERTPTPQTLQSIVLRHPQSIPFENLDALLRVPIGLDAASLQRKLVDQRRGGWCYEHNLLLGHALTALGFRVIGLAARVMWHVPDGMIRPRTHMLLRIEFDEPCLVDVGFGGLTLTGVLHLTTDVEQTTPHEPFRLMRGANETFVMEARVRDAWHPLYAFDLQPQAVVDYEATNWYLCNHPQSHFLSTLIAARVDDDRRYALRNGELSIHRMNGTTEQRTLTSAVDVRQALDRLFHVEVPRGDEVDAVLDRLLPAKV
jgi:N-hydroxyarylamine O-acetyltransferase